jgi:membrane associated rhomboid family serine protease
MVQTPVGIKCADDAGVRTGAARVARSAQRFGVEGQGALLTKILIGINVAVYILMLATGGGTLGSPGGDIFDKGALIGIGIQNGHLVGVAQGEWWRLVTSMFLHASILHLGLNMLFLWWVGAPVEEAVGRWRFALIYLAGGLGGAAGALLFGKYELFGTTLATPTVGASGALFGILGAALVYERQRHYVLGGAALSIIVLNLVLSFTISGISIGGHLGGLAGGALCILALSKFGKGNAAYSRIDAASVVSLVAIGLLSVAVAYWKVKGYA